ncbi:homocysteine S-methyltransferase family protein [Striga asiatica]|uniref:Homocysteine S-methyltransferase family protein n=1 Tax=Striga asiatica TaxID=4170 RepID=A0A5A7PB98_STRAF|nr:homocysteine S-methyltransferase family protein [Striga asiatica]
MVGVIGAAKATANVLEDLIESAGGCAVVDGGFATQLEKHGASINDPLWSALCLIKDPHLINRVHLEYLEAGADVIVTSSYQATIPGFVSRGLSTEEAESLLTKSVKIATEARDKFWASAKRRSVGKYNRALVAASIGSYGAYLADGSEYSGNYGPKVTLEKLKDFHRRRLQVLVKAGPDLLAFETIPNKLEAQACVELLDEENVEIPSWICFSSVDGENAPSGESFEECLEIINKSSIVRAVGINCAPPHFILNLIHRFKELTSKAIVVYPNSGEIWDGVAKRWLPSKCFDDDKFEIFAGKWRDAGAQIIGGCCRTTPSTIQGISEVLKEGKWLHLTIYLLWEIWKARNCWTFQQLLCCCVNTLVELLIEVGYGVDYYCGVLSFDDALRVAWVFLVLYLAVCGLVLLSFIEDPFKLDAGFFKILPVIPLVMLYFVLYSWCQLGHVGQWLSLCFHLDCRCRQQGMVSQLSGLIASSLPGVVLYTLFLSRM